MHRLNKVKEIYLKVGEEWKENKDDGKIIIDCRFVVYGDKQEQEDNIPE